ncbi:WD repeat-containing protein 76-like [Clytia hemisphaerica]|uniref:WD repeat-containing protein 76 n=1 Tax=Clytia hemisphaerica TaxID=252671 RepID=A0A7M5XMH4_9CNID
MAGTRRKRKKITPTRRKATNKKIKTDKDEQVQSEDETPIQEVEEKTNNNEDEEEDFEEFSTNDYQLSELELLRKENMKKNFQLFEEFQINKVKDEVKELARPKLNVVGIKREKREKPPKEILPRRVSLRIRKLEAHDSINIEDYVPLSTFQNYQKQQQHNYHERKEETVKMTKEDDESNYSEIIQTWLEEKPGTVKQEASEVEFSNYSKEINSLFVSNCGKVTKSRICSIAIHPSESKTIAAFGDKQGAVGIWDVGSNAQCKGYPASEEVLVFEPHSSPINCLKFRTDDCTKLMSCSYDGTLRQGDFAKQKFTQVFAFDDSDNRCYSFSNPLNKPNIFLLSTSEGSVALIDSVSGKAEMESFILQKNVKCIDCHPSNEYIFAAVGHDGTMGTWDIRNLKTKGTSNPIFVVKSFKTGSGLYFSPGTGNKLAYTSNDDTVRIFDVKKSGEFSKSASWTLKHDNHTGRWLTPFRATWDPKTENCFVIGSMGHPRKLDVYSCVGPGRLEWIPLRDDNFGTVGSVNAFHPTKNILISGNSSGKAHVWS